MTLPRGQIAHVGLKVFDDAALVRGSEICAECVSWNARMTVSCARRTVSKLNVRSFQSVNSPHVEPVSTRLPSGVHYKAMNLNLVVHADSVLAVTTLTGHRILFVEVSTNLVHSDVHALSG
jgi:hypothetical protein